MTNLFVLSGAGISAESGLQTFRDKGGLWDKYDPYQLASPEGWQANPELVLEFYNVRRQAVRKAKPNTAHLAIKKLEEKFDVTVITQNVDNLHERAGSSNVIHLHGEIMKARSSMFDNLVYELGEKDIRMGDMCEKGYQLRPHVVWFGEAVPMISTAANLLQKADILIVIGTGLSVYPAASLISYVPNTCKSYIIDPNIPDFVSRSNFLSIPKKATEGMTELAAELLKND